MADKTTVKTFLKSLGFNSEQALVYLCLLENGAQTVLELNKKTNVKRTQVYRIIEDLLKKGVLKQILDEHKTYFRVLARDG